MPAAARPENRIFNEIISAACVVNENCIALLKNRWSSLKGIHTQVWEESDFQVINHHILCCGLLHNIAIHLNDEWDDDADLSDSDNDLDDGNGDLQQQPVTTALQMRARFHGHLFE